MSQQDWPHRKDARGVDIAKPSVGIDHFAMRQLEPTDHHVPPLHAGEGTFPRTELRSARLFWNELSPAQAAGTDRARACGVPCRKFQERAFSCALASAALLKASRWEEFDAALHTGAFALDPRFSASIATLVRTISLVCPPRKRLTADGALARVLSRRFGQARPNITASLRTIFRLRAAS